jgi:hypothetical protein
MPIGADSCDREIAAHCQMGSARGLGVCANDWLDVLFQTE